MYTQCNGWDVDCCGYCDVAEEGTSTDVTEDSAGDCAEFAGCRAYFSTAGAEASADAGTNVAATFA